MRIRQIVFAARDLSASRELLSYLFQMPPPFRDPGVAEFGIDNAVFNLGDQFIEVVSPTQADSACSRHLARYGDSGYMLLLQSDDLARDKTRFASLGIRTVWSAEFDNIVAMHLHPKDVGGAIVSVDEPRPASSWRWGGPLWQGEAPLDRPARQSVRGMTLYAREPESMARRWAEVFGRTAPVDLGHCWRAGLTGGFADFALTPNGLDGVAGFTLAVSDPIEVLARARQSGLAVTGQQISLLGAVVTLEKA